jgi:GTP cyclohydrolase I
MSASEACVDDSCSLPDIANEPHSGPNSRLNWVGMSEIEMPVFLMNGQQERIQSVARVQAYVNLIDPKSKGIHMSRLYLAVDEMLSNDVLTPALLSEVVESFAKSHHDLSDSAYLECRVDFFERRKSLKSDNTGWKSYKVRPIISLIKGEVSTELCIEVPYSSTCPCSAALARDLIQQGFEAQFAEQQKLDYNAIHAWLGTTAGISATPHSQRSVAQIRVKLNASVADLPISRLIDQIEGALKTPVQAAVKRADEQEFARLNASNLMFCEDAARRLQAVLDNDKTLDDFWVRVNHMESLHPHNAVAVVVKGLENGYRDDPREFPN